MWKQQPKKARCLVRPAHPPAPMDSVLKCLQTSARHEPFPGHGLAGETTSFFGILLSPVSPGSLRRETRAGVREGGDSFATR